MSVFSHILVPLDGSALAEDVMPRVAALARLHQAQVVLLRVALAHTFPGADPTESQVRAVEEATGYLERVRRRFAGENVPMTTAVRYGPAAQEILDHAVTSQADLIAMATHGRSGIRRWIIGSVAESVVRGASVPVLLLRASAGAAAEDRTRGETLPAVPPAVEVPVPIRHVLCPVDLGPACLPVIEVAGELAARFGATLTLLHVTYDPLEPFHAVSPHPPLARLAEEIVAEAERKLRESVEALPHLPPAHLAVVPGAPVARILQYARSHDVSVIVLGTRPRRGLGHLIRGDVAEQVVRLAACPVLTIAAA